MITKHRLGWPVLPTRQEFGCGAAAGAGPLACPSFSSFLRALRLSAVASESNDVLAYRPLFNCTAFGRRAHDA